MGAVAANEALRFDVCGRDQIAAVARFAIVRVLDNLVYIYVCSAEPNIVVVRNGNARRVNIAVRRGDAVSVVLADRRVNRRNVAGGRDDSVPKVADYCGVLEPGASFPAPNAATPTPLCVISDPPVISTAAPNTPAVLLFLTTTFSKLALPLTAATPKLLP